MKNILFVISHPPYQGSQGQETLDVILTAAAFDQPVSLLLLDDGVFQLIRHQRPEKQALKDTMAIFTALQIYDVHNIYIEAESLQERNLKPGDLCLPVREFYRKNISALMKQHHIIVHD